MAGLAICFITLIYQSSYLNNLKTQRQKLEKELALYNPLLTRQTVQGAADRVKMQKAMVHQYAQKYMGLAAMEEVSDLTPQYIRLISFRITQGNDVSKTDASKAPNQAGNSVAIEGIIFDKKDNLESDLSKYVIKLEESPMFNGVTVQKKDITAFKKNEVLHFTLSAKTG